MRLTGKHETAPMEQVQLRRRRPRRFDPRAALLRQQRLQGLSGRSPSELAGRPLPDRFADPEDDRRSSDRRQGGGRLSETRRGPGRGAPGLQPDPPRRRPLWRIIAFDDSLNCSILILAASVDPGPPSIQRFARAKTGIHVARAMIGGMPGTRLVLEGFYKVRFQLGDAVGRSVMYAQRQDAGRQFGLRPYRHL